MPAPITPNTTSSGASCAPSRSDKNDKIGQSDQELRDIVREKYAKIAVAAQTGDIANTGCCSTTCCTNEPGAASNDLANYSMIGDAYDSVRGYVADADMGLGCGLPVEHAGLEPSHIVVDLGSGAGLDAFIARREVGPGGHVIGVDMTPQMITKARQNAAAQSYDNVEFRLGEIENLPVENDSTDVVISNCVLNLVPDKPRAFSEIYRILKPGGHFCISDVVASKALPDWTMKVAELYVGCVAGAIPRSDYLDLVKAAGFKNITIKAERRIHLPEEILQKHADQDELQDAKAADLHVLSITLRAQK